MISSLRRSESMASHSSFLSHSSRRERAEDWAWAARVAAALVLAEDCVADVADAVGSLGLALAGSLEFAEVGSVNC